MAVTGLTYEDWLARVPELLSECVTAWGLTPGRRYDGGVAGRVVAATLPDGTPAVLKLGWLHRESEHEADALELWDGDGAVRLLARDDRRGALLLERCEPGTFLSALDLDAALDVLLALLPRLWKPAAEPFRSLSEEAAHWEETLPVAWQAVGRPFERRLLDAALAALRELAPTQGEQVLLHQDLHAWNVLAATREPWLVIDPKPLVGEREFAVAPLVRGGELGHGRVEVRRRFDRLTGELGLDRERARGWTVAQTIAWGVETPRHAEVARWLLETV